MSAPELFHTNTGTPENFKVLFGNSFPSVIKRFDFIIKISRFFSEKLVLR